MQPHAARPAVKRSDASVKKSPEAAREAAQRPVEELTLAEAKSANADLISAISKHDRLYYQEAQPEISDAEYDKLRLQQAALEQRFPSLITLESPSLRVGAPPAAKFAKVRHAVRMLSLGNVFTDEEARDFVGRVRRFLKLGESHAARCHRGDENRRPFGVVALRARRAGGCRHARRRQRGRGRHRQCAHHRGHSGAAEGPARARCLRGARRGLYVPRRFRRAQ